MTYDRWKTADDTPEDDAHVEQDELDLMYERLDKCIKSVKRLRASHDRLLAAAKATIRDTDELCMLEFKWLEPLKAAIAAAGECAP